MPEMQQIDDEEFPVLTDVVKEGDSELIEAARLAQEEIERSLAMQPPSSVLTPAEISRSITAPSTEIPDASPFAHRGGTQLPFTESQLEHLIDEIVERHAEQMRNELYTILKHRK
ncbi:MAG: hypothetical protein AAF420_09140 [Pseudomonadota bacterium]